MNQKDLLPNSRFIAEFHDNVLRSMSLRIELSRDRVKAIRILEEDHKDPQGLLELRRCVRNERRFLKVIDNGLRQSLQELNDVSDWVYMNIKDKKAKNKVKRAVKIVSLYSSKTGEIERRLALEESFLERQDNASFKRFVSQWGKEIKLNRKLLKLTVDSSELEDYFKKTKILMTNVLKAGVIGGSWGALIRIGFFTPEFISLKTHQPLPNKDQILISAELFGIFAIIVSVIMVLQDLEERVEAMNLEEFKRARKSI